MWPWMFMNSMGGAQGNQGHSTLDWLGAAGGLASPILGALGGLFGGGQERKDQKWGRQQMQGLYNKPTYNIPQLTSMWNRSYQSQIEPMTEQYGQRYGMNSGRMMQEMLSRSGGDAANFTGNMMARGQEQDMLRKMQIAQQMFNSGRG